RPIEEEIRVLDDVLIQRVAACHHERHGAPMPAACASRLLPSARHRARVAVQDAGLQLADIDAELQRVRADDPADLAAPQPALDLAPQLRQVSAAIAANRRRTE